MKDVSSLKKKLAQYSAMAGAMIAANSQADAQVVYHDIIPDDTLGYYFGNQYELDLNNDGTVEFLISWSGNANGFYGLIVPYGPFLQGQSVIMTQYDHPYFEALNSCENISSILSGNDVWSNYSTAAMIWEGYWTNTWGLSPWINNGTDKYAGLRLHLADGYHYGWIRMTCNIGPYGVGSGFMVLKDYAYQTFPDSSITTPCAQQVKDIVTTDLFNAFVTNHQLILHFHQSSLTSRMILFNDVGMKLSEQAITQSGLVMDVSRFPEGIYFVEVIDGEQRQVKKVIIE